MMQEAMNRTAEAVASPPATPAGDTGFLNSGDTAAWIKSAGDTLADLAVAYAPRLILALIVLVIGLILIKILSRTVHRMLHLKEIDPSISTFLGSVIQVTLWLLLAMSVLGMVGVEVTSFLAMFTAATVAIGFALKETLQNFAAGVIILVKRPFSVGDFIECAGKSGTVQEIRFFDTLVTTSENITVIIPNNSLATTTVTNYARQSTRRMQVVVGIGYEDDIDKARLLKVTRDSMLNQNRRWLFLNSLTVQSISKSGPGQTLEILRLRSGRLTKRSRSPLIVKE